MSSTPTRFQGSPGRTRLARLFALTLSTGLSLLGLELGLRVFWDGYYLKGDHAYAQPHSTRGWANIPDVSLEYGEPEYRIGLRHNSLGFRGPEVGPKSADRTRVLLLGDSFAYGLGAEEDETLAARLEALDPHLEVLNAGVNGYGTGQELLLLRELGEGLKPDIVVLAFFWNDIANNVERDSHRFQLVSGQVVPPPPIEVLPAVSTSAPPPRRNARLRHSYLYRFTSDRMKSVRFWAKHLLGIPHEDGDRLPPERREAAWTLERALMRELRDTTAALGARLLVVIIPEQAQVQPDAHVLGLVEADYQIQDRLLTIGREEGIAVADLLPGLARAYAESGTQLYYRQDRHLRPGGIAVAAEQVLAELRDRDWIPGP